MRSSYEFNVGQNNSKRKKHTYKIKKRTKFQNSTIKQQKNTAVSNLQGNVWENDEIKHMRSRCEMHVQQIQQDILKARSEIYVTAKLRTLQF